MNVEFNSQTNSEVLFNTVLYARAWNAGVSCWYTGNVITTQESQVSDLEMIAIFTARICRATLIQQRLFP
jgi:hypothetical protein